MQIMIKPVASRKELRKFIHLPEKIHKNNKNWLPPIYLDEWKYFNPSKNKSFSHCDTILALAYRDNNVVGRIMGIINHKYNEYRNEKHGRFGYLECYDDQETAHALLTFVEEWAAIRGMDKMIGPYGFSDKDPQGLMTEGFEHKPIITSACNLPYLVDLIEHEGYKKEIDCLVYLYYFRNELPEVYYKVYDRIKQNDKLRFLEFRTKRELRPYIIPVLQATNDAFKEIYGFVPMDDQEMKELAHRYLPVIRPEFVKVVTDHKQVVAFVIGIPSLTEGIQKSKGYLFPFGIFKIIQSVRKSSRLDLMLGGIKEEHRGKGLAVMMGLKLIESARALNYQDMEIHLMLETNTKMLAEVERIGAQKHKRFRVFYKEL